MGPAEAMGAVDVVGRGEGLDAADSTGGGTGALVVNGGARLEVADSTGGGAGALVVGEEEPVPIGGGAVVPEAIGAGAVALDAGAPGPGAATLEAGALGTAEEGDPLGVGTVELPFNPAPPSNLPAKHCVMSGTSVAPVGVRERT